MNYWAPILIAALALLQARMHFRNHELKRKLQIYLKDCRAFYEIEARYSEMAVAQGLCGQSAVAAKRFMRLSIRADGLESPSEFSTPLRISQELAKL